MEDFVGSTINGEGRVLIILPHNPGDVIMALQAISILKKNRPQLQFDYMVSEECQELILIS